MSKQKIAIQYRGFEITFSENAGTWRCWDLDIENVDISKVKAKIDHTALKLRKENSFDCLYLGHEDELIPAKIIEYLGEVKEKGPPFGTGPLVHKGYLVAAMRPGYSVSDRPSRQKDRLKSFVRPGPTADAIQAEIRAERETIKRAQERILELRGRYPRVTIEDIATLVKIAEGETPEEEG